MQVSGFRTRATVAFTLARLLTLARAVRVRYFRQSILQAPVVVRRATDCHAESNLMRWVAPYEASRGTDVTSGLAG